MKSFKITDKDGKEVKVVDKNMCKLIDQLTKYTGTWQIDDKYTIVSKTERDMILEMYELKKIIYLTSLNNIQELILNKDSLKISKWDQIYSVSGTFCINFDENGDHSNINY